MTQAQDPGPVRVVIVVNSQSGPPGRGHQGGDTGLVSSGPLGTGGGTAHSGDWRQSASSGDTPHIIEFPCRGEEGLF